MASLEVVCKHIRRGPVVSYSLDNDAFTSHWDARHVLYSKITRDL